MEREEATLFRQLVFRAVSEDEISVSKGAELLRMPVSVLIRSCHFPLRGVSHVTSVMDSRSCICKHLLSININTRRICSLQQITIVNPC